jgi:hypothetical protein
LQVAAVPRWFGEDGELANVFKDACAEAIESNDVGGAGLVEVELDVGLRGRRGELME